MAHTVLIGYDGSDDAKTAITQAVRLFPGAHFVVLCAWMSFAEAAPTTLLALPGRAIDDAVSDLDAAARQTAEDVAHEGAELVQAAAAGSVEPRVLQDQGPHFDAIIRCADEIGADVIVVGSRGRSPLAAAMLGSVSTGVLNHAHRPVLVVGPPRA